MSATQPRTKKARSRQPAKPRAKAAPVRFNIPGRMPDEVFEKVEHAIRTMTAEEFRQKLIEFGVTDKKGRFYSAMPRKW